VTDASKFNERISKLLREKPRLVNGVDRVCMATGHGWSLKRKREYEERFGRMPDWVMNLHLHLTMDLCRVALECGRPLWHLYQFKVSPFGDFSKGASPLRRSLVEGNKYIRLTP
jgi:hypothetical protein